MCAAPIKIDPTVKALWVEALRSDEHVQGTQRLHQVTGEKCCLGVLSCLYAESFPGEIRFDTEETPWGPTFSYDWQIAFPPSKVLIWAGLMPAADGNDAVEPGAIDRFNDNVLALSVMNDVERKTFAEIADYIEAHL